MNVVATLASEFAVAVERSAGWESAGAELLPILRAVRTHGGDSSLSAVVETIVGAGIEQMATAALAYLGDVVCDAGLSSSPLSFELLQRYLSVESQPHERLGASAGMGSIMDPRAADELRAAARAERLEHISAFQLRASEVIERNGAADPENPNAFALAV